MSETATILEVGPKKRTLWTMPKWIYEIVSKGLTLPEMRVPTASGRHRRPTVEEVVKALPVELQKEIVSEVMPPPPKSQHNPPSMFYFEELPPMP